MDFSACALLKIPHTPEIFPDSDLVFQKGTYFYEYMGSRDKFEDTKLPPREQFYSHLKEESVSEDEYAHVQKVWNEFNIKNLHQYHDLYLTLNVLLLADVFKNFRRMSFNYYELDPCHYYTIPGLSFDASLKMTKIELELLCDPEQFLFVENSIRERVTVVSHRHATENNEFVPNYNPDDLPRGFYSPMPIICMVMQWVSHSQPEIFNFSLQKKSNNLTRQKQQLPTMFDSFS